jgi:peptide/nickel transport system ATP-binding protein
MGIVGESGCGKSVSALSIMRLLPKAGVRVSGSVLFEGRELAALSERQMRDLRGNRLAMIFQEPMTSLNPSFTVGDQIGEALTRHRGLSAKDARAAAIDLLDRVRIPSPRDRVDEYPHKLSGGMRQRVMIAMALACAPALLIADEPTTALDVTIQAQILELLNELKAKLGMAIMLITHDMGVIAETAQRVVVMYGAQVVEEAPVGELFKEPLHPYTQGLLRSIPRIDVAATKKQKLEPIPGTVPTLRGEARPGCRFAPRCALAKPMHFENTPPLKEVRPGHKVACFLY